MGKNEQKKNLFKFINDRDSRSIYLINPDSDIYIHKLYNAFQIK